LNAFFYIFPLGTVLFVFLTFFSRLFLGSAALGETAVLQLLLRDPRVDPSSRRNAPLLWACANGHADAVALLLADARVSPTEADNAALRSACRNGHARVVRLLLRDPRVNPSAKQQACLLDAIKDGHVHVVRQLIAHPAIDVAARDQSALTLAFKVQNWAIVDALLANPTVMLPGRLDMQERAKWGELEAQAVRYARSREFDEAMALLCSSSWRGVGRDRLRALTLLCSASYVLQATHALLGMRAFVWPLLALVAVLKALHPIVAMVPTADLVLMIVQCITQRRRFLALRAKQHQ
jgi:hypothetical protein